MARLEAAPQHLREAVGGLEPAQLETPYRESGWTVRQVVYHLPDSHRNSYIRFKWALTENAPVIKPYREDRWATLPDTRETPPSGVPHAPQCPLRALAGAATRP